MLISKKVKKYTIISAVIAISAVGGFGGFGAMASTLDKNNTAITETIENKEAKIGNELDYKTESENGSSWLVSVKLSDEKKFSPEEWEKVLKQIENGEVYLEEENLSTEETTGNKEAKVVNELDYKTESENGSSWLVSVKLSDEKKFSPEEWEKVLKQIEDGEVYLEE